MYHPIPHPFVVKTNIEGGLDFEVLENVNPGDGPWLCAFRGFAVAKTTPIGLFLAAQPEVAHSYEGDLIFGYLASTMAAGVRRFDAETMRSFSDKFIIGDSDINGLGVFARLAGLVAGFNLGMIRGHRDGAFLPRTVLGGFVNHSYEPNCEKFEDTGGVYMRTIRFIEPCEELTVKYDLYDV